MAATSILWFRRDLRMQDNAALEWACENSSAVIPVYIYSADEEQPWAPGAASRWWLHHSLLSLQSRLAGRRLKLYYFSGSSEAVIEKIIAETGANRLVYNRVYERQLYERDLRLEKNLKNSIDIVAFDSGLLFSPGTVLNSQQLPYRVFTPFYNKLRPQLSELHAYQSAETNDDALKALENKPVSSARSLQSLQLLDEHGWHEKLGLHWRPGEDEAHRLLDVFLEEAVQHYATQRDIPSLEGTSRLSPYLHFGEITPQQVCLAVWPLLEGEQGASASRSAEVFVKQLIWREFAHNVLWHFPETATLPMDRRYRKDFWRSDIDDFNTWTKGETGVPIIDAGMKQLWETGWMHNRVRMIVSSFLTKNLGINWLHGARWFWDTLVDADLANNSLGWQWVAGCGVDAAPYYRVFNPNTQTRRFDSELRYVEKWLPEHAQLDYPSPMVDLGVSREDALHRYKQHIRV
ncbi:MAG: DNA photolyase family protein [Gammaproteobacteria bacterium]|nr:DNA photolyase family protein [Gammaproteobacteria bacterium]